MHRKVCYTEAPPLSWTWPCAALVLCASALLLDQGWPQAHAQTAPTAQEPITLGPTDRPLTPALERSTLDQAIQRLRRQAGAASGSAPSHSAPPSAPLPDAALTRPAQRSTSRAARSADAADLAPRDAAWLLGLLALHGIGMPADPAQAQQWFAKARQWGHPMAAAGLAWCEIDGCTGAPHPAAARTWIAQLRSPDPARALYLEWWVVMRLAPLPLARPVSPGSDAQTDTSPHRALLLRAAQAGSAGALTELGLDNVAQGQLPTALERFKAASDRSPAAASNADLLASRMQGEDAIRATGGATAGDRSAGHFFAQAQRYHRGVGVPSNYAEAIRLYQVASASGSAPARRMLELIYSRPTTDGTVDIAWMQQLAQFDVSRPGSIRQALPAPGPQPFVRDPTPLYDLVPPVWRAPGSERNR